ncbi:MAG: nuclear transport factor 2 family protein [Spirochaetales bacterium]|nr:nuclear transport factor 2 family protein [Spirochaetales bacterium]
MKDLNHYLLLWKDIHSSSDGSCYDHILPYYDENIYFKDTVQEIRGLKDFTEMTERLSKRSKKLEMVIHSSGMQGELIFVEWEMIISYKKFPKTSISGVSRTTLKDGKIIDQRDYYDLWGDIFKNIKFLSGGYRRFMRKRFG